MVVEFFADLQSPVTKPALQVVYDVMRRFPEDTVRLQFRNFPLAFHPQSATAHEAAMTAAREGRFWEFATYVLDHQDSLRDQDLIGFAGRLGIDSSAFQRALYERRHAARVEADLRVGQQRGIRGSPALVVNGARLDGVPSHQALTDLVQGALATR